MPPLQIELRGKVREDTTQGFQPQFHNQWGWEIPHKSLQFCGGNLLSCQLDGQPQVCRSWYNVGRYFPLSWAPPHTPLELGSLCVLILFATHPRAHLGDGPAILWEPHCLLLLSPWNMPFVDPKSANLPSEPFYLACILPFSSATDCLHVDLLTFWAMGELAMLLGECGTPLLPWILP